MRYLKIAHFHKRCLSICLLFFSHAKWANLIHIQLSMQQYSWLSYFSSKFTTASLKQTIQHQIMLAFMTYGREVVNHMTACSNSFYVERANGRSHSLKSGEPNNTRLVRGGAVVSETASSDLEEYLNGDDCVPSETPVSMSTQL